jgi:thiamine biosynthesis lipoprotein
MGTLVDIVARGPERVHVERSLDAAFAAVEQVERLMSFHSPDSELSRLNRSASAQPQLVHRWTYAVLQRARRIAAASDGLFDIAIGSVLVQAGLLPSPSPSPAAEGAWRDLVLLPDGRVWFRRPMLIDLGGIAKGFAVDQAIHALRRGGCTQGVVNAGGDLRRFGAGCELVHARGRTGLVPLVQLRCGALATSGGGDASPERLAQPIGNIVDPRSGRLWGGTGGVSVAARCCTVADALTKVAALAGPACRPLLARFGAQAVWWAEGQAAAAVP